jgi:hypothetical protein
MATEDCPFKVVRTNGSDEVLARALVIGHAAFETAKQMFPKNCLEYRHGAQITERHDRAKRQNATSVNKRLLGSPRQQP